MTRFRFCYAIGEYSAYGSGSATATLQADGRLKYTMSFTWNIWDPYDWNAAFGGADAENALLHLVGRAKQFLVEGSFTKTAGWPDRLFRAVGSRSDRMFYHA